MGEWISVKDRNPKRGEYLAYQPPQEIMGAEVGERITALSFTGKRWITSLTVTHWMPLPAPPEPHP